MDCKTATQMIPRYLADHLKPKELAEFLDHMDGCSSCREELGFNFFVQTVLNELEDPGKGKGELNIVQMLSDKLQSSHRLLKMQRIEQMGKAALAAVVMFAGAAFLVYLLLHTNLIG